MAIIKVITPSVTDANITTAKVTDNAITLAKMASGTDGNIIGYDASGNPVAIATGNDGQVLTSTGAGSPPAFETLPVGGITNVDMYNMSTQTLANGAVFASGWSRETVLNGMPFGTGVGQSSGVFSFPNTGLYKIDVYFYCYLDGALAYVGAKMEGSSDGFSSNSQSLGKSYGTIPSSSYPHANVAMHTLYQIDNVNNNKFRLKADSSGTVGYYQTYVTFIRLSDG